MDFVYTKNLKIDVYLPIGKNFKTIVFFHGGGINSGSRSDEWTADYCEHLRRKGFCVFNADYSLYPNAKFPEYIEDAAKAVKKAFDMNKELGGNGEIYVSGQSAGAYLTMMLCSDKRFLEKEGIDPLKVKGWISDSAQLTDHFHVLEFEEHVDPWLQRISEHSPIYFVNKGFKSSPIYLFAYENDMFCRVEQNILFKKNVEFYGDGTKISLEILKGNHCEGSTRKDDDGEYPLVKRIAEILK